MSAGPSTGTYIPQSAPILSGPNPGILDHTQPDRLCRRGSKLSFASFDPHAASSHPEEPDIDELSLNEKSYRPKRIVIETTPSGVSSWRFVPSARREEGVTEEGKWPRVVDICGKYYEMSQDQWDFYKLDPSYDCYVRAPPNVPVISPATEHPQTIPSPAPGHKRRVFSPAEETPAHSPKPRKRRVEIHTESEDEQSEVEDMIVDDGSQRPKAAGPKDRKKKLKEKIAMNRKERHERTARRMHQLSEQGNAEAEFTFTAPAGPSSDVPISPTIGKRKVTTLFEYLHTSADRDPGTTRPADDEPLRNTMNYVPTKDAKRTRTVSPSAAKRNLAAGRQAREKHKTEHRRQEHEARRQAREAELLEELYTLYRNNPDVDMPDAAQGTGGMESGSEDEEDGEDEAPAPGDVADDEETRRQAEIAESRRKLAELEADRPMWEEAAAKRKAQERREAEAQAEARRRAEEAERREGAAKERREQEERWRREGEEAYRNAREEAARRYAEQDQARRQGAKRERNGSSHGHWTVERAKERYSKLADRFDKTKYSEELPLTADDVPWPMLSRDFVLEDVTWQAVAEFFKAIQPTMTTMDYKKTIIKSHLRFHTDRWASRRLLESVKDEAERGCIEIANKMVIQQLTPIWEGVCGKKADHPHY